VKSLNGEEREIDIYKKANIKARDVLIKFGFYQAISFGTLFISIYLNYGVGLWSGGRLIEEGRENPNSGKPYTVGDILTTFFAVLVSFFAAGTIQPALSKIAKGREAASEIYNIIETKPHILEDDSKGHNPKELHGEIEFRNVHFSYPSRPKIQILKGLQLKIPKGKKVAFVGETGCGKSTTVQLIERFYDPNMGDIFIDGKNLKEYNLQALRKFIGYVGQEPVLFGMTIEENLKLAKPDATSQQLEKVLKDANAWEFVNQFEKGIKTNTGLGGSQMSGGQKQRIAIARAMLLDPPVLLLDESTSALDRKNEKEIQETLDKFAKDRTTILIAHRLQTIRNADIIYVLKEGKVLESGNHEMLMRSEGNENYLYWKLVKQQEVNTTEEERLINTHVDDDEIHVDHDAPVVESIRRGSFSLNDPFTVDDDIQSERKLKKFENNTLEATGERAHHKIRKENQLKNDATTMYHHNDGHARLRKLQYNDRDNFSQSEAQSKIESIQHFSVSANMHSFHESASNISRKSSFIPVTNIQTADGYSIKVPYGKMWDDLKGHRV